VFENECSYIQPLKQTLQRFYKLGFNPSSEPPRSSPIISHSLEVHIEGQKRF